MRAELPDRLHAECAIVRRVLRLRSAARVTENISIRFQIGHVVVPVLHDGDARALAACHGDAQPEPRNVLLQLHAHLTRCDHPLRCRCVFRLHPLEDLHPIRCVPRKRAERTGHPASAASAGIWDLDVLHALDHRGGRLDPDARHRAMGVRPRGCRTQAECHRLRAAERGLQLIFQNFLQHPGFSAHGAQCARVSAVWMWMVFASRNSARPSIPFSRPKPLCLQPPNGSCTDPMPKSLM